MQHWHHYDSKKSCSDDILPSRVCPKLYEQYLQHMHCGLMTCSSLDTAHSKNAFTVESTESDVSDNDDRPTPRKTSQKLKKFTRSHRKKDTRQYYTTPHVHETGRDWFTLKFDLFDDGDVELIPAVKGRSLSDAVQGSFQRRGLKLASVNVYLDASNTPLPLHFDSFPLGGHQLHVKVKDPSYQSEPLTFRHRSSSFNNLTTKGSLEKLVEKSRASTKSRKSVTSLLGDSISPDYLSCPSSGLSLIDSSKRSKSTTKLGALFNAPTKEKDRMEQLGEILDSISFNGLPVYGDADDQQGIYELEESWYKIVGNFDAMPKKQRDQQEAIWELLLTEVTYLKKLKVITDVFMACLVRLQKENLLTEIGIERLFSNIAEICQRHCLFWQQHLSKVLLRARETHKPLSPLDMQDGFYLFEDYYQPYIKYCLEETSCVEYLKMKYRENELFKTFIVWGETQKQCGRLKLSDLLVKPMQRLTKYPLLMKAVLKKTEDLAQREALISMISNVERFVSKVNGMMRKYHEQERLSSIMNRIESYDVIESFNDELDKLVQDYTHLDLRAPMPGAPEHEIRQLLIEGPMRIRDREGKMDAYGFLFTDMFLLTKPTKKGDKTKIIKQPMLITQIVIQELKDPGYFSLIYLNEFKTASFAFTIQVGTAAHTRTWIGGLEKAKKLYGEAMLRGQARRQSFYNFDEDDSPSMSSTVSRNTSFTSMDSFDVPSVIVSRVIGVPGRRESAPVTLSPSYVNDFIKNEERRRTSLDISNLLSAASQNKTPPATPPLSPRAISPTSCGTSPIGSPKVRRNPLNLRQKSRRIGIRGADPVISGIDGTGQSPTSPKPITRKQSETSNTYLYHCDNSTVLEDDGDNATSTSQRSQSLPATQFFGVNYHALPTSMPEHPGDSGDLSVTSSKLLYELRLANFCKLHSTSSSVEASSDGRWIVSNACIHRKKSNLTTVSTRSQSLDVNPVKPMLSEHDICTCSTNFINDIGSLSRQSSSASDSNSSSIETASTSTNQSSKSSRVVAPSATDILRVKKALLLESPEKASDV